MILNTKTLSFYMITCRNAWRHQNTPSCTVCTFLERFILSSCGICVHWSLVTRWYTVVKRCWTLVILCLGGLIVRWSVLHRSLCGFKRSVLRSLRVVNITRKLLYVPQSFLMHSSIHPTRHERTIQRTEPKSQFLAVHWKMRPWSLLCDSTLK